MFIKGRWEVHVKGIWGGWVLGKGLIYILIYALSIFVNKQELSFHPYP